MWWRRGGTGSRSGTSSSPAATTPRVEVYDGTDIKKLADPVRNGNRWQVYKVDPDNDRIAARRIGDGARAVFSGDYLGEHVTHGYAVTVHAAQGTTADTTHAVLGEGATRAAAYVAMTRGRASNNVYLYDKVAGEGDHEHAEVDRGGASGAARHQPPGCRPAADRAGS